MQRASQEKKWKDVKGIKTGTQKQFKPFFVYEDLKGKSFCFFKNIFKCFYCVEEKKRRISEWG